MTILKRIGHFLLDVLTWFFPNTYDAFDQWNGPHAQFLAGMQFAEGCALLIVGTFTLIYVPDIPWLWVVVVMGILWLLVGTLYAAEMRRRSRSAWDTSWPMDARAAAGHMLVGRRGLGGQRQRQDDQRGQD